LGKSVKVACAYPSQRAVKYQWHAESGVLSVELPQTNCARLFELG
jgi:hypothetical protein